MVVSLAERGFLVRGAVTVGGLYHNDRHVVGPAMVRAYEMESKAARFPRVIVDPSVVSLARTSRSDIHTADDEERYVRSFIAEDEDGRFYFDWVAPESVVDVIGADPDVYPDYLERLSRILEKGLTHSETSVLDKHLWVHRHYIAALDKFDMPANHPYRIEYPEHCDAIMALPRFEDLAAAASSRVNRT